MITRSLILLTALIGVGLTTAACLSSESAAGNNTQASASQGASAGNSNEKAVNATAASNVEPSGLRKPEDPAAMQTGEIAKFSAATGSGSGSGGGFAKWNIIYGADQIEITEKGLGSRLRSTNETKKTDFILYLNPDEIIDNVSFAKYGNDLLMLYGVSSGGYGAGRIVRFDDAMKRKWTANIGSFNVGNGLIEGRFAYIGATGFAGKIDLESGKFLWKHGDLYRKYDKDGAFNIMEVPELKDNTVVFTEKENVAAPNSIVFNKETGEVVRVKVS